MNSSEHQQLTSVIKGVHSKLRKELFITGDPTKVWLDHLKEEELRKQYANSMLKLATEVWNGKECRIQWSYQACMDYFYGGGLQKSLLREIKLGKISKNCPLGYRVTEDDIAHVQQNSYENLNRKLRLLDVGSCYNPFSKFQEFSCVAIDITPATEDVLQCDFLTLDLAPKVEDISCIDSNLNFHQESFDIVVFSLVLEYVPAAELRAVFCYKAWKLLQENGLCIVITPDSKSVNHNVHMMKSWKSAFEKLGFVRVKYDKLQHLHCMAFRKTSKYEEIDPSCCEEISKLLYIPQDFRTYEEIKTVIERTEKESCEIHKLFSELPDEHLFF